MAEFKINRQRLPEEFLSVLQQFKASTEGQDWFMGAESIYIPDADKVLILFQTEMNNPNISESFSISREDLRKENFVDDSIKQLAIYVKRFSTL